MVGKGVEIWGFNKAKRDYFLDFCFGLILGDVH